MKKKVVKKIIRFTTFNTPDCIASTDEFVQIFLKEVRKSDHNLVGLLNVEKRHVRNRVGPESLGLSVRFYSDDENDFHHIENALIRAKYFHVGLPAFLKCRLFTTRKPKNVISVKFGRRGNLGSLFVSNWGERTKTLQN